MVATTALYRPWLLLICAAVVSHYPAVSSFTAPLRSPSLTTTAANTARVRAGRNIGRQFDARSARGAGRRAAQPQERRLTTTTTTRLGLAAANKSSPPDDGDDGSPAADGESSSSSPAQTPPRPRPGSLEAARLELNRVPYGEESRKYRRTVFTTNADWQRHRSPDRLWNNLADVFVSGVARQIRGSILIVLSVAVVVILWNGFMVGWIDFDGVKHLGLAPRFALDLPSLPFTLCSPALGLLLVFRTNASYQRWTEARTTVTKVVSQLKNVLRMSTAWVPKTEEGRASLHNLSVVCWVTIRAAQHQLRGADLEAEEFETDLREVAGLSPIMVDRLLSSDDVCTRALLDLTNAITHLEIDEKKCVEIDKSAVITGDCLEACSKIYASPIPLVYTRHTARFLASWMILLPLALYDQFSSTWNGLGIIPATALISLFLFGIDELSVQLEEPFSILPFEASCDSVKKAGDEAIKWHEEECS